MNQIENILKEVFQTKAIEYNGVNFQTNNHTYFLNCDKIDAKINSEWTKNFPDGSYFSISKGVSQPNLSVTVDVTKDDVTRILRGLSQ